MVNLQDFIENTTAARKFKVDDLLFAEFRCPMSEEDTPIWWHHNFFAYILAGESVLRTPRGEYAIKAGDSLFAKKGSMITQAHMDDDFCELLIFVPDDFVRTVIKKYNVSMRSFSMDSQDTIVPIIKSDIIESYFQSLITHFVKSAPPSEAILKLKFEELLLTIITDHKQDSINHYLAEICHTSRPSIKEIMEANFHSNLSLSEFARMCARSLSAFKKEFNLIFHSTPGKWLQERRLKYARFLLETTAHSIDEICMEGGFENKSHFIRVFKNKFGVPPGKLRSLISDREPTPVLTNLTV